jgi:hypothetical protein
MGPGTDWCSCIDGRIMPAGPWVAHPRDNDTSNALFWRTGPSRNTCGRRRSQFVRGLAKFALPSICVGGRTVSGHRQRVEIRQLVVYIRGAFVVAQAVDGVTERDRLGLAGKTAHDTIGVQHAHIV